MSVTATLPERYNASTIVDRQIAAARGPKIAFVAEDRSLTYDALASEVNRAGRLLLELGVGREDRVLLVLDDTTVFPVVFLAAMRIGAIPVPVSPLDRADNFRHYVRDSYASLVVTDADRLETVRTALADEDVVYLARGAGGPGVVDLDAGMAAQDDRARPGRDPPRRHGVLAVQLGVDGQAEGRRAPAARHRDHLRELRAQRPRRCATRT